ncbi:hypothetical protein E4U43_000026 [Claviceps pusilla]|uniref:DUF7907 domain-containing protein n=1 Tax=Claviceps pusilla TaxID=123648 RepID=A0A9P7NCN1_9HYPO|nr:hypothetical protein E4U43_000026 [Claviceps pusilla]
MHFLAPLLSLGGLALASPLIVPRDNEPPTLTSKGFNLVINVTDLSRDFSPSVHGKYIDGIHVGAAESLLGSEDSKERAILFYVNGTEIDVHFAHSNVVSDFGTPLAPRAISLTLDKGSDIAHTAHMNGGSGDKGIGLTRFPVPYTFLYPETYAICDESVSYYPGRTFRILKQFQLGLKTFKDIPSNCVPVRLLPQCAKLNDLPPGSFSSHQWAYESPCYDNVAAIDWKEYPAW